MFLCTSNASWWIDVIFRWTACHENKEGNEGNQQKHGHKKRKQTCIYCLFVCCLLVDACEKSDWFIVPNMLKTTNVRKRFPLACLTHRYWTESRRPPLFRPAWPREELQLRQHLPHQLQESVKAAQLWARWPPALSPGLHELLLFDKWPSVMCCCVRLCTVCVACSPVYTFVSCFRSVCCRAVSLFGPAKRLQLWVSLQLESGTVHGPFQIKSVNKEIKRVTVSWL